MSKSPKKTYVRPQIVRHGKVESLTLGGWQCAPSGPVK